MDNPWSGTLDVRKVERHFNRKMLKTSKGANCHYGMYGAGE